MNIKYAKFFALLAKHKPTKWKMTKPGTEPGSVSLLFWFMWKISLIKYSIISSAVSLMKINLKKKIKLYLYYKECYALKKYLTFYNVFRFTNAVLKVSSR